jgi:PAS domain S-box-containing protein
LHHWIGINLDVEEHNQAQFYLAEGQRLAHTGSWAFNSDGFQYWSSQFFEIHGLDPGAKAPSIPEYMALVHPEDRDSMARAITKILSDHRGFDFTKRIVRPDGAVRYVRCLGIPEPNGPGFVGTGIDVTEQEQLTKALRTSEEELRQILDITPQPIAVLGPHPASVYRSTAPHLITSASLLMSGAIHVSARKSIRMIRIGSSLTRIAQCRIALRLKSRCGCAGVMETIVGF